MDNLLLKKYAVFSVETGVNLQKGQTLLIASPIECAEFARMCAEAAYEAGAREVVMIYNDEKFSRLSMEKTRQEVLEDVKPWFLKRYMDYYESEGGVSILHISARDPELYKGLDVKKINAANQALRKALKPWRDLTMSNRVQWSIVSIPTEAWALKVFPGNNADEAVEKLWAAIFDICRVTGGDPVGEWREHTAVMSGNCAWLNGLNLEALRLTAGNGTDIVIGLAEKHVFAGGGQKSPKGGVFLPNIPTEEVFTAPHCRSVNGVVKSSMPYVFGGNLIEGITAKFVDGVAVEYSAEKGGDLLEAMLSADGGAKRLGEIALVPASNPVKKTGLLFYSTLYDENAACHIAFGAGYPDTIEGGDGLSREEQNALGLNDSLIHEDIMIGTDDMNIVGITKDGGTVDIFKNGEWVRRP